MIRLLIVIIRGICVCSTCRALLSSLPLIRKVCLLTTGGSVVADVTSAGLVIDLRIVSGVGRSEMALLIMHKLLGNIINGTSTIHASKIITIKFALHARGCIGAVTSSTCAA